VCVVHVAKFTLTLNLSKLLPSLPSPPPVTTHIFCHPGSHGRLLVAILVPVMLLLVAITAAITIVAIFLVRRWRMKRSDAGFQRITFNDVDFEDSDDDEK